MPFNYYGSMKVLVPWLVAGGVALASSSVFSVHDDFLAFPQVEALHPSLRALLLTSFSMRLSSLNPSYSTKRQSHR